MEESKRIRLLFNDDDILSDAQKSDGLDRSWVLLKPNQYGTVSDVASHLLRAFHLHQSCPHGLLLSISGFVLPPFESTCILKDNEIIRVRKRRDILPIEGNNAANEVGKLKGVEKQPVNTGVLLLANEEFEKEKVGYDSDDPEEESEEEDEEGLLEDIEGGNADCQNRKRKATEKLQVSKKKRQRTEATGDVAKDVHIEKVENDRQAGDLKKKKNLSSKESKPDSNVEDNAGNNEENSKLSDKNDASVPGMKRKAEVQENGKETEDAKVAPKETKKVPSRSARRKYVKRRWLREMAKIQKTNATCESEGLRNWKEDQAKAEKNKVDSQSKGLQKWKKHRGDSEKAEVDDQPKGLLHWKQSSQNNPPVKGKKRQKWNRNDYFHKHPNQNGDVHEQQTKNSGGHEQPTENGDEHEQPNNKHGDEQPSQENGGVEEHPNENGSRPAQSNQESDDNEENEVVPIVIRPGHIRFEPLEKEEAVQKNHVPVETFQWNGITSKKKGQQWGKETRSFTPRNDYKNSNKEYSEIPSTEKEKQSDGQLDFDKLPPLPSIPKEGDLIAYRVLELSSTWTPELSAFRVGKVSLFDAESNQTILVPVSEYPIVSNKGDDDEAVDLDSSLYKEDGSLEIDFSTLIDVRMVKNGSSGSGNGENALKTVLPISNDQQSVLPDPEDGEINEGKETQPPNAGSETNGSGSPAGMIWKIQNQKFDSLLVFLAPVQCLWCDEFGHTVRTCTTHSSSLADSCGWLGTTNVVGPTVVPPYADNCDCLGTPNVVGPIVVPPYLENDGLNLWDQVSEALSAKKEQLSKENSWGKTPKKVQLSYENSWGKNAKKVQQSPSRNKWGKNTEKVQPSQENSWGKQNSGGKSWSYKALRGSALGPTMAILRSKNNI
ncbi:hypothetical protein BUALT_Bualt17G0032400 [Buddleja alternifolia]|uniref:Coilin n=1 Tax=Buddleja alternifolia TaxID=168488 RepID=A0AAV6WF39_9LAMI|nr:hypothetical protein BUALT_Bualt17G0032400 [Buddleja alternifolia]